jgi:hypothetical protein
MNMGQVYIWDSMDNKYGDINGYMHSSNMSTYAYQDLTHHIKTRH